MSKKIDIKASKNEDVSKDPVGLYFLLTTVFIAFTMQSRAQTNSLEVACDTTVFGLHYTRCVTNTEHHMISFGNLNEVGQRHGWWCELRKNGKKKKQTEYIEGHPVRERWVHGDLWRYDDKGNIISKGKGCGGCPVF